MTKAIVFDTETTGFPEWKKPSGDDCQPHLVQLAALLVDESGKTLSSLNLTIKPDGWVIPDEVIAIHGITNEIANDIGVPESVALDAFIELCGDHKRVCYNRTFDQRIIRIATKRFIHDEDVQNKWAEKDNFDCAMMKSQKIMGGKRPNLAAALKHFTGEVMTNAHDAMADTIACKKVYLGILEHEKNQ